MSLHQSKSENNEAAHTGRRRIRVLSVDGAVSRFFVQVILLRTLMPAFFLKVEVARRLAFNFKRNSFRFTGLVGRKLGLVELGRVNVLIIARHHAKQLFVGLKLVPTRLTNPKSKHHSEDLAETRTHLVCTYD